MRPRSVGIALVLAGVLGCGHAGPNDNPAAKTEPSRYAEAHASGRAPEKGETPATAADAEQGGVAAAGEQTQTSDAQAKLDAEEAAVAKAAGPKLVHHEPVTLGERTDGEQQVIERIEYEEHSLTFFRDWEGHPHGQRYKHFFFQQPGKPRRELKFLNAVIPISTIMKGICEPVAGSDLWVTAGFFDPGHDYPDLTRKDEHISVVVFDPRHVVRVREIPVQVDWYNYNSSKNFWFGEGNRTIHFYRKKTNNAYDVVTDSFHDSDAQPPNGDR